MQEQDSDSEAGKNPDDGKIFQTGHTAQGVFNRKEVMESEAEKNDERKNESSFRNKHNHKNISLSGLRRELNRTENTDQNLETSADRRRTNTKVVDRILERIVLNDPTVNEVNLNNIQDISQESLLHFAEALCTNTNVHVFSLSNTQADDRVAFAISKTLHKNQFIRNLNIESNFVSGKGILALLAALQHNRTLVELRFHNQRHICGGKVEMEMIKLLRENTTLLKLGYHFHLQGPRMTATSILMRNQNLHRQKRLRQKIQRSPSEVLGQSSKTTEPDVRRQHASSQSYRSLETTKQNPIAQSLELPTQKVAEVAKQQEGLNATKSQSSQRKAKVKKPKNGANEKESADVLKDLRNALKKPLAQKTQDGASTLHPPRPVQDELMAAIRGSSIGSLKRVGLLDRDRDRVPCFMGFLSNRDMI